MNNEESKKFGNFYWCVKTDLSQNGEIYVHAETATISPTGDALFLNPEGAINLSLASGSWTSIFAASLLDGAAVAVEHWKGEVVR